MSFTRTIPEVWPRVRLKYHVQVVSGYPFDSTRFNFNEGMRLVRIRDLLDQNGEILLTTENVPEAEINDGDLLIGMDGDFNLAEWRSGLALLNQRVCKLKPRSTANPSFLRYVLPSHLKVINDVTYSTTVKHLSTFDVGNISIGFPNSAEQRRIARYLDEVTGKVDRLVALRRRQMELLREQRAALIQQAVTRGLNPNAPLKDSGVPWIGPVPRDWQLLPLRAVLTERGEFNTDLRTTNFLSVLKDVGVVPYAEREASGNKKSDEMDKYKIIHPGDIVANRMNLIFGSVGLSAHFGCSSTEYYVLRARNASVDTQFYGLIFQSKAFQRSLVGIGSGILAHRMRIYYEALKTVILPVPSFSEQQQIVAHVKEENDRCDALHRSFERQLELLTEYRAALIHECVTGQRAVE